MELLNFLLFVFGCILILGGVFIILSAILFSGSISRYIQKETSLIKTIEEISNNKKKDNINEKYEEGGFLFKGNEMISKDMFFHRGESYPIRYNCMPVDLKSMRKLKQHLLDVGYNEISIIRMLVFGGNNFLVIAEKTKNNRIQVQSDLPEDLSFFNKLFRKVGLF